MRQTLYFSDLVLLRCILINQSDSMGVLFSMLTTSSKRWLEVNHVGANYGSPIEGRSELQDALGVLTQLELIYKPSMRRGWKTTEKAERLFDRLGDRWQSWFLSAPVVGNEVVLGRENGATYAPDYRRLL